MADRLWGTNASNLLTFQTRAAWEQKVRIYGSGGIDVELVGSGEQVNHWQKFVGPGTWTVEAWYRTPGTENWIPSRTRSGRGSAGVSWVGADDGGGDGDFEDALVTCTPVMKSALEQVAAFLKSMG